MSNNNVGKSAFRFQEIKVSPNFNTIISSIADIPVISNTHRVLCVTLTTLLLRDVTAPAILNRSAAIRATTKTPKLSTIASYWTELTTLSCLSLPAATFSISSHHLSTVKFMAPPLWPTNRSKTHRQRSQWVILRLTRSRRRRTLPRVNRHRAHQQVV